MHEFSLINDLLKKIESLARTHGSGKVVRVGVRLGALAHISAQHFREHFEDASRGTMVQDAKLDIEISSDTNDPQAQDIILETIDLR